MLTLASAFCIRDLLQTFETLKNSEKDSLLLSKSCHLASTATSVLLLLLLFVLQWLSCKLQATNLKPVSSIRKCFCHCCSKNNDNNENDNTHDTFVGNYYEQQSKITTPESFVCSFTSAYDNNINICNKNVNTINNNLNSMKNNNNINTLNNNNDTQSDLLHTDHVVNEGFNARNTQLRFSCSENMTFVTHSRFASPSTCPLTHLSSPTTLHSISHQPINCFSVPWPFQAQSQFQKSPQQNPPTVQYFVGDDACNTTTSHVTANASDLSQSSSSLCKPVLPNKIFCDGSSHRWNNASNKTSPASTASFSTLPNKLHHNSTKKNCKNLDFAATLNPKTHHNVSFATTIATTQTIETTSTTALTTMRNIQEQHKLSIFATPQKRATSGSPLSNDSQQYHPNTQCQRSNDNAQVSHTPTEQGCCKFNKRELLKTVRMAENDTTTTHTHAPLAHTEHSLSHFPTYKTTDQKEFGKTENNFIKKYTRV